MDLPDDWLGQIREVYPRRPGGQGWGTVKRLVPALVKQGNDFEDILKGAKEYGDLCRMEKTEGGPFVRMAQTFFGPGEWWMEDYSVPEHKPRAVQEVTEEMKSADILAFERDMKKYGKSV